MHSTAEIANTYHDLAKKKLYVGNLTPFEQWLPTKVLGIRAMLPHVDEFRTVHNLESLLDLTRVLSEEPLCHVGSGSGNNEKAA